MEPNIDVEEEVLSTVVSQPESPAQIDEKEPCRIATTIKQSALVSDCEFVLGSLVFDCSDYAAIFQCIDVTSLANLNISALLKLNIKSQKRVERCKHSLYSLLICSFTNRSFACTMSQANLHFMLNTSHRIDKNTTLEVDKIYQNNKMEDWSSVFASLTRISIAINCLEARPGVKFYSEIVNEICRHPLWIQRMIEDAVNLRCGPLMYLATRTTQENINYIMGKLKLTTNINLLHQLFCSPSVMGKCAALVQLLEVNDLMWKTFDVGHIENLIPTFYTILEWIMDKCQAAKNGMVSGFQWVRAKFRRIDGETDAYPGLKKDLPETPELVTAEHQDLPPITKFVSKKNFVNSILYKNVFAEGPENQGGRFSFEHPDEYYKEIKSASNSCLIEAAFSPEITDLHETRQMLLDVMLKGEEKFFAQMKKYTTDESIIEGIYTSIICDIAEGNPLDVATIIPLEWLIHKRIFVQLIYEQEDVTVISTGEDYPGEPRWICMMPGHYEASIAFQHKYVKNPLQVVSNYIVPQGTEIFTTTWEGIEPNRTWIKKGEPGYKAPIHRDNPRTYFNQEVTILETPTEKIVKPGPAVQTIVPESDAEKVVEDLESTETGRSFLEWLKSITGDVFTFFKNNAIIGGILAFAFSILSALGISVAKFKTLGEKKGFWETISASSKDFYYLSRGREAFSKVFADFGSVIKDMIGYDDTPEITAFKENLTKAADDAERMNTICNHSPGTIVNDPQQLIELKKSLDKVRRSYFDVARYTPTANLAGLQPIWSRLNNAYTGLEAHYAYFVNRPARRVRPVCVWLWGSSNTGKSELAGEFIRRFNIKNGTAWETHTVSKGPEYLNGFKQQKILLIDDFDSFKMVEGCLDALLIMNMVTSAPYNPNIANLDEKGIQANPALIVICSNFSTCSLNCGVNDLLAFERRRDFLVEVEWLGGHETCSVVDTKCPHWEKVYKKMEEDGVMNFDHLTLTKNHPLIYSNKELYKKKPAIVAKNASCDMPSAKKVSRLGQVGLDALVDETIERAKRYQQAKEANDRAAELVIKAANEKLAKDIGVPLVKPEADIESWKITNNVLLRGVPGIGKSVIMGRVKQILGDKAVYIETLEQFEMFATNDWVCGGVKYVIFDDFTTFRTSAQSKKFWRIWKERADGGDEKLPVWMLGLNDLVAMDYFSTLEEFEVYTRDGRNTSFHFTFLPKTNTVYDWAKSFVSPTMHCTADLSKEGTYDSKVKIVSGKRQLMSDQVVTMLTEWEPARKVTFCQDHLPIIEELLIDATATLQVSSDEFITIVNSDGHAGEALGLIKNATYQSKTLSKIEMGKRLTQTFYEMRCYNNCKFSSMDDFILCGSNADFFKRFNDGNYVMNFTDKSYCLMTLHGRVSAGIYCPINVHRDLGVLANGVVETISTMDFLTVCRSNLPPWFAVAMSVAEQVTKAVLTTISIPQVIKQNNLMFKQMIIDTKTTETTEKYVDKSLSDLVEQQKKKLKVEEKPSLIAEKPLSPSIMPQTPSTGDSSSHTSRAGQKFVERISRARGRRAGKKVTKRASAQVEEGNASEALEEVISEMSTDVLKKAVPQIVGDEAVFSVMNTIFGNLVDIQDLAGNHIVNGIILAGHTGTTVAHMSKTYKEHEVRAVDHKGNSYRVKYILTDNSCDRLDFTIDSQHHFKNIRKHIADAKSDYFQSRVAILINVSFKNGVPILMSRFFRIKEQSRVQLVDYYDVEAFSYSSALSGYVSELPPQTAAGDCGGIVLVCDSAAPKKIVGMHIGSNSDSCYFRPITSAMYPPTAHIEMAGFKGPLSEFTKPLHPTKDGLQIYAKTVHTSYLPDKTKIYRSLFEYDGCDFEPSVLSKLDPRAEIENLVFNEAMKWTRKPIELTPKHVEQIRYRMSLLGDWFGQKLKTFGIRTKILTKQGALNTVRGYSHSKPIHIGTSAGYPFSTISVGKRDLIEINEKTGERAFTKDQEMKELLHIAIDHVFKSAKKKELAQIAFSIFPKDELLKKSKLKTKTRTIAASPIHLTIALRMYFHTINAAIAELWHILPIKNGIAPNSTDWHTLVTWLQEAGDEGFSLDQKDFDFNSHPEVNRAVVNFDNAIAVLTDPNWTYEDDEMRSSLRENLINFYFIVLGLVYRAEIGVASGQPHTTPDNSKISLFYIFDAFCDLAPSWIKSDVNLFMKLVRIAVIGDDVLIVFNKMITGWFNGKTVPEHLNKKYNLVFTPSDKSADFYRSKPIEQLDFLSRTFKFGEYSWYGPLKWERLMKPLHFCHGTKAHHWFKEKDVYTDQSETSISAAQSALQEMFFHGEEEYERLRKHCLQVVEEKICNSEAYFPPYSAEYNNYYNIPSYIEKGIYEYSFSITQELVPLLTAHRGWIKYKNRRCLVFGDYYWDLKTENKFFPIPDYLQVELNKINSALCTSFNSVLVNEYRTGGFIPWHKDDEPQLNLEDGVACVTLIGNGQMQWSYKENDTYPIYMTMSCYPGHSYHMCGRYVTDMYHQRVRHTRYTMTLTFRTLGASA